MNLPTQAQIGAGIRYAGGYIATGGALIITFGLLPSGEAHGIVDASQKVLTDLQQLVGDSYLLVGLVAPVIMAAIARMGWNSASPAGQVASLKASSPGQVAEAVKDVDPKTLVAATQSLSAAQVTVSDPALASPGVKVVASSASS